MSLINGDNTIDGRLVQITISEDAKVTKIVFPDVKDGANNPFTITLTPGLLQSDAEALIATLIQVLFP